jgi:hypothetical protein
MIYSSDKWSWPQSSRWRILTRCTLWIRGVTRSYEIFIIQGILMRFDMMDYTSMTTPMINNFNKLRDSTSDSNLVDPQCIGS